MKRRWRLLASVVLFLLIGAAFSHPAVHWRLIGWWRGEAFYRGRPTSWWAQEIEESYNGSRVIDGLVMWVYEPPYPLWDLLPAAFRPPSRKQFIFPPPLFNEDPNEFPVLCELLKNENPKIRKLAAQGLKDHLSETKYALVELLSDEDDGVKRVAGEVIKEIAPEIAAKHGLTKP